MLLERLTQPLDRETGLLRRLDDDPLASREQIDRRNRLDQLCYTLERTMNENKDKLPAGDDTGIDMATRPRPGGKTAAGNEPRSGGRA